MGQIQSYIENILPSFLDDPASKKYLQSFGQMSEDFIAEMQFARDEGLIANATPDTFDRHLRNSSLLRSPLENDLALRKYLLRRFLTWRHGGSVKQLQDELARFGYPRTKVVTWTDLIQQGVPHPFGGGFTTIVGGDIHGGVRYIPLQPGLSMEHKTLGPNSPLRLGSIFPNFWVELETDGAGFAISSPIDIVSIIQRDPFFCQYLGCGWLGDGHGKAVTSTNQLLPFGYFSFFYVEIDTPNGFEKPILWDEGDEFNRIPMGGIGPVWDQDIHFWDMTPPYANAYSDVKKIIRKFKPVTMSCRFVRIRIESEWLTVPIGEKWEEDPDGNIPDFFTSDY